jgi:hypothetical protein
VDLLGEVLGGFSQSLTRWPLNVGERHQHREPELHHLLGRHQRDPGTLGTATTAQPPASPAATPDGESWIDDALHYIDAEPRPPSGGA